MEQRGIGRGIDGAQNLEKPIRRGLEWPLEPVCEVGLINIPGRDLLFYSAHARLVSCAMKFQGPSQVRRNVCDLRRESIYWHRARKIQKSLPPPFHILHGFG